MSVWRTITELATCTGVNVVCQVAPPSVEYSVFAPGSMPVRTSPALLVILSVDDAPVSLNNVRPGVTGVPVSSVNVRAADGGEIEPAALIWRTMTEFRAFRAAKAFVQLNRRRSNIVTTHSAGRRTVRARRRWLCHLSARPRCRLPEQVPARLE